MRAALLALLLIAPAALADPIELVRSEGALNRVTIGSGTTWVTYKAHVVAENASEAYVKITPFSGNLAYLHGDPQRGWWTEVAITGPAGTKQIGAGNGTDIFELGELKAGTPYIVALRIRVPGEYVTNLTQYTLAYSIALLSVVEGGSSGGSRDPSVDVLPVIRVVAERVEDPTTPGDTGYGPLIPWIIGGFAIVAAVIAVMMWAVRRAKRPEDPERPELEEWAAELSDEQIEYLKKRR